MNIVRNHTKESLLTYHQGEDCLSKLCKELRQKATELINTKTKPLT